MNIVVLRAKNEIHPLIIDRLNGLFDVNNWDCIIRNMIDQAKIERNLFSGNALI